MHRPFGKYEFAGDYRKIGFICRVDVLNRPYEISLRVKNDAVGSALLRDGRFGQTERVGVVHNDENRSGDRE